MTCWIENSVLATFVIILVVVGIRGQLLFNKYCQRVAELENRLEASHSLGRGEIGMNSFEIEQFGRILARHYTKYDDSNLVQMGTRLRVGYFVQLLLFFLVLAVGLTFQNVACF
jgi:hypothetical protein